MFAVGASSRESLGERAGVGRIESYGCAPLLLRLMAIVASVGICVLLLV